MKGSKLILIIAICVIVAMIGGLYIFSGGKLGSWSEADETGLRWMLGLLLSSITTIYTVLAFKHFDREQVILNNWKLPDFRFKRKPFIYWEKRGIKLGQSCKYAALFFLLVLVFGLGGGNFSKAIHYLVTLLGALATYFIVVRSQEKGLFRTVYAVAFMIAGVVWLISLLGNWFGFRLWTVFDGENAFIVPALVWVFAQLKNIE